MVTEIDEGKGLVKVYWADIRDRVKKVEPAFAKIVDELNPDSTFPLYLAYYPYGDLIGDTRSLFIPGTWGGYHRLSDPTLPKDIVKHLGYGMDSAPLGMVLEKQLEYFIDLKNEGISIPWLVYSAGMFFPFSSILNKKSSRFYPANGILTTTSGVRSAFMLPNIGCATHHSNLQRDFNVQSPPPKSLYEHWHVFKEIVNSGLTDCNWNSCIIYFSEKWINKLYSDKAWLTLKIYFYELAWSYAEYKRSYFSHDFAFSMFQKKRNLKPNPYLADTARHLFITALGAAPGYTPTSADEGLPVEALQKAFVQSYGLKTYLPTIMQPTHFNFETDRLPIYYSLQNPSTHVFSPKSRKVSSTLFEMRELEYIMRIYIEELSRKDSICFDTVMSQMAHDVKFHYFHNKSDRHHIVKPSHEIAEADNRFDYDNLKYKASGAKFAGDARFVRGCIMIAPNEIKQKKGGSD
jgi:hypothetical protein